jgi:hypothetical protein
LLLLCFKTLDQILNLRSQRSFYSCKLNKFVFYSTLEDPISNQTFQMMYVPTHTRGSPYFIGMAFGYLTFLSNTQKFQLSQVKGAKFIYLQQYRESFAPPKTYFAKFRSCRYYDCSPILCLFRAPEPEKRELVWAAGLINFFLARR